MTQTRWLLPFTCGIDMQALNVLVRLTCNSDAILVPLSIVPVLAERPYIKVRLEHIQQSKDFLEAVLWKSKRLNIPVERYEIFSNNTIQTINTFVQERGCESILVVIDEKKEIFLHAHERRQLLESPPCSIMIIHLPINQKEQTSP